MARRKKDVSIDAPEFMEKHIIAYPPSPSTPQLLMGEAIQHLQGRQKQVYLLVMREDRSLAETAKVLGIGKSTAQSYLERAVAFIKDYCQMAIEGGRV